MAAFHLIRAEIAIQRAEPVTHCRKLATFSLDRGNPAGKNPIFALWEKAAKNTTMSLIIVQHPSDWIKLN
jgi:hypothetical protein